jgi:hypothetical protein
VYYPHKETCDVCGAEAVGVHECSIVRVVDHQREKERERVVQWLRDGAGTGDAYAVMFPNVLAAAVERGEHLKVAGRTVDDEKRMKHLQGPYFEPGCRCVIIANDNTAGTYCPVHGDQK